MNILLIGHEKDNNGASLSLLGIISELEKDAGNNIHVLAPYPTGAFMESLKRQRVKIIQLPCRHIAEREGGKLFRLRKLIGYRTKGMLTNIRTARALADYVGKNKIEIIHSNSSIIIIGAMVSRLTGVPHVMHLREFGDIDFKLSYVVSRKRRSSYLNRHTKAFICVSKAVAKRYSLFDESKKRVIYNGIGGENRIDRETVRPKGPVQFLIAGRITAAKGQETAVKAAMILLQEGITDFHLNLAGSMVEEISVPVEAREYVTFHGLVKDMPALRRGMDVELVCSRAEAFGRITAEAMMGSMPVIGSNTGGTTELIREGETGFLYSYGDAGELAERMGFFISHPDEIRKMGQKAQDYALEHFTIARCVDEIKEVYREVLSGPVA